MRPLISMRQALTDEALFGTILGGESWNPWRTLLIAAMGEPLDDAEREIFKQLTGGREREPLQRIEELICVIGRRGGKSRAISALACFLAACCQHDKLVAGETGVVLVCAPDQRQAGIILDYCAAMAEGSPLLSQLIEQRTQRELRLNNNITIEVRASDFRTLRGPTYIAAIIDECAFLPTAEISSSPDSAIVDAVRPGLSTTGGPLVLISSPYSRKGELWAAYDRHFGANGHPLILVAQAASKVMNASLPQSVVDRAYERDPVAASAEYGALFRSDLETFLERETILACVDRGIIVRPPQPGVVHKAFIDASSGAGKDSMCAAIGHRENDSCVIDALTEVRPPFSPPDAVAQIAATLKTYGITHACADRWGLNFVASEFARHNIELDYSDKPSSEIFRQALPIIRSSRARLVDNERMLTQFCNLERRILPGGNERIGHPERGNHHDDVAVVTAGCLVALSTSSNADNWIEYYRREAERAQGFPTVSQEHPAHAWNIGTSAPVQWIKLAMPPALDASTICGISGRPYCARHIGDQKTVDVIAQDAVALLEQPIWRQANPNVVVPAKPSGAAPSGVRASDVLQAIADAAPSSDHNRDLADMLIRQARKDEVF
jgi:hypothetical protein